MRIIDRDTSRGPDQVRLTDVAAPDPTPREDELLVRVGAAGVNPADLLQVRGLYPPAPGAPSWPGLEVAGTVVATGADAPGAPGDRVAALLPGGGYAELVAVRAEHTLPVPDGLDDATAASLPEGLCTAWSSLVDVGGMGAGDTVLVHGGAGGVGSLATQLALVLGCRVVTTARGPERVAAVQSLLRPALEHAARHGAGTDALTVLDRTTTEFETVLGDLGGADVVIDVVGAANLGANVRSLARDGRLVVIGLLAGRRGELDLGELLARRASVRGTTLRSRSDEDKARIVSAVREHVWPLVAAGTVRARVDTRVPFADADRAHDLLRGGDVVGKVVLVP